MGTLLQFLLLRNCQGSIRHRQVCCRSTIAVLRAIILLVSNQNRLLNFRFGVCCRRSWLVRQAPCAAAPCAVAPCAVAPCAVAGTWHAWCSSICLLRCVRQIAISLLCQTVLCQTVLCQTVLCGLLRIVLSRPTLGVVGIG